MSKFTTVLNLLKEDKRELISVIIVKYFNWIPDSLYLKLLYQLRVGHKLNLKNPRTFTEKIQWLKLYDRKIEYTKLVDKYEVKKYIQEVIGNEFIIPTIGVWSNPNEIEWDALPEEFVLKTSHGGGGTGVVICKNKSTFDKEAAISKLKKSLASNIYVSLREWPYKNIQKRIIAERFMKPKSSISKSSEEIADYKFYCFNGEPKYCQVIRDRSTNETIDFYDMNWNHMDFIGLQPTGNVSTTYQNSIHPIKCPVNFSKMKEICIILSKDKPFIRVDLYEIDNRVYFGELTLYPASGMGHFTPEIWNDKLGSLINI